MRRHVCLRRPALVALLGLGCGSPPGPCPEEGPTEPIQLTSVGATHPTASPDDQWVAFQLLGGGIAKIRPDGTGLHTLTETGREPDWSRPGSLIVFRDGSSLFTVDASSGEVRLVASGSGIDDGPGWSPLGDEIAVHSASPDGIVVVSYPGGELSPLACMDPDGSGCAGEGPSWAPDAQALAFEDGLEILRVPRAGGTAAVVVSSGFDVTEPAWSPDGRSIAFVADSGFGYAHIWVAEASGMNRNLRKVTEGAVLDVRPAWSPGSQILYFASDRSGQEEVWKVGSRP